MKVRVIKLGTICADKATGLAGTLTHWIYDMGHRVSYLFQPKGVDENGQPVKKLFVCEERVTVESGDYEEVDVPFEILGTIVTDKASGFTGMAIDFIRHINGCFHVTIQPSGKLAKKNVPILANDFDLRGCTGEMIVELSETNRRASIAVAPSPMATSFERRLPT